MMTTSEILMTGAVLCGLWATLTVVLVGAYLDQHGIKTNWFLMRLQVFRNLSLYREETRKERGSVGALFYSFVVSINAGWVLALLGIATR